jgi:hypothetical protein
MIEGHACVVGPLPEGMDIGQAVGEEVQYPAGGDAVGGEEQVRFRRLIHPVGVLKDCDLRTHLSGKVPRRKGETENEFSDVNILTMAYRLESGQSGRAGPNHARGLR